MCFHVKWFFILEVVLISRSNSRYKAGDQIDHGLSPVEEKKVKKKRKFSEESQEACVEKVKHAARDKMDFLGNKGALRQACVNSASLAYEKTSSVQRPHKRGMKSAFFGDRNDDASEALVRRSSRGCIPKKVPEDFLCTSISARQPLRKSENDTSVESLSSEDITSEESFRRSARGCIPKKMPEDFLCSPIPAMQSGTKPVRKVLTLREFFATHEGDWTYGEGLDFENDRVRKAFSDDWAALRTRKIAEQRKEDLQIAKDWQFYFSQRKSRRLDPLDLPLTIQTATDPSMGLGVFATENLPRGFIVGEYSAIVSQSRNKSGGYVFNLSTDSEMGERWCYDARFRRNHTAFLNHSTNPNVDCYEYYDKEGPRIVFYLIRPVAQGEELMINYGSQYRWS